MFKLDGISGLRKMKWTDLRPGCIILDGIKINDKILPELASFPVLTSGLLHSIKKRYQFLEAREVLVADPLYQYSLSEISEKIRRTETRRQHLNLFRKEYGRQRTLILHNRQLNTDNQAVTGTTGIGSADFLIKDNYNSFSYLYGLNQNLSPIPSFFHRLDLELSLQDLLTHNLLSRFNLPADKEVMLHLVVDYSRSMDSAGKLELIISAVNSFYRNFTSLLANTVIQIYVFSDTCQPVPYPLRGREIKRGETSYTTFIKKVLHHRNRDIYNKIILFTDGLPGDQRESLKMAGLIKKNKLDYTQIIFNIKDEQRHEVNIYTEEAKSGMIDNVISEVTPGMQQMELSDEALAKKMNGIYKSFTEFAVTCGGNQIILEINELAGIVSVECYDRYLGLLSLATGMD